MAELQPGDLVVGRFVAQHTAGGAVLPTPDVARTRANEVRVPERMSANLATFLGMIAADGHLTEATGAVGLTTISPYVEAEFVYLARELFGLEPRLYVDPRNGVHTQTLTSRRLCRWILGILGNGAYAKRVPDAILQGSVEEKRAFLRGLTLDGYYQEKRGLVVYAGMSQELAKGVAALCHSFGLPLVREQRKWVPQSAAWSYGVLVSNEMQAQIVAVEPHKNGPVHYAAYQVLLDGAMAAATRLASGDPGYTGLRSIHQRRPRTCSNVLARRYGWPDATPVFKVTMVEDAGSLPLYDIEVEEAHEYTVNSIV